MASKDSQITVSETVSVILIGKRDFAGIAKWDGEIIIIPKCNGKCPWRQKEIWLWK
jgi:hypothetical protein